MVARTVNVGSPQVTAKIVRLEDLGDVPSGFFDATQPGGDQQALRTVVVDEPSLRKNLLPAEPISWPVLLDGPLEGTVSTEMLIDREGNIREVGSAVAENPGVAETAEHAFAAMCFKPFLENGVPVQVVSQVTLRFKTTRPVGTEDFPSAQTLFDRGRQAGFPAAAATVPYVLHAEFEALGAKGTVETGRYEDTWLNETHWRREAWFEDSHYVRSRNEDKTYQLAEGAESGILRLILRVLEPIPAIDTFTESDWKIKRDTVDGASGVRVLAGHESPSGKLDPEQARAYWFDETGLLVKTFFNGIETHRTNVQDFVGVRVARQIDVRKDEKLAIKIRVTEVSTPTGTMPPKTFEVHGHEWKRAFTSEVR